ncbi:Uncharacterised protein [Mycobacterium tuberculosis]|nr:Uncharacterised protein [Mycobacterium tuberculosis]
MTRPSACRRMRVVRWSRRNRSSSSSALEARRSIWSSSRSCRCSSDWLRQDRFTNTRLMLARSSASPIAVLIACRWTVSNASLTSATSRVRPAAGRGVSVSRSTRSPRRSRATTRGSRSFASSCADRCSRRSSSACRRANSSDSTIEARTASSPTPPARYTRSMIARPAGATSSCWSCSPALAVVPSHTCPAAPVTARHRRGSGVLPCWTTEVSSATKSA